MARVRLVGSLGNRGEVFREGDRVLRPVGPHTPAASTLLEALARAGFLAPVPAGFTPHGEQRLSWIEGDVAVSASDTWVRQDAALSSAGRLLARYHAVVAELELVLPPGAAWARDFADPRGGPVLCHNDVSAPNVVFRDGVAVALIDFDFAAPGRALWDLAQMARMWLGLVPPHSASQRLDPDTLRRLVLLLDAYGLPRADHAEFVVALADSWRVGNAFIRARCEEGQEAYLRLWERRGGASGYAGELAWLTRHSPALLAGLEALRR